MGNYSSMASMMGANSGTAGVPTQTFSAANVLGTPTPVVGDNKGRPNYAQAVGTGVSPKMIVLVAVILIAVGYAAYHINFEV